MNTRHSITLLHVNIHYFTLKLVIIAISTHDTNVISVLNSLFSAASPPKPYNRPYMDPNIPKHIIIFHDARSQMNVENIKTQASKLYDRVTCITINTAVEGSSDEYRNSIIWKDYFTRVQAFDTSIDETLCLAEFGRFISDKDLEQTVQFLNSIVSVDIIPYMEKSMQMWNEHVSASFEK